MATARALWAGSARRVLWVLLLTGVLFDLMVRHGAPTVSGTAALLAFVIGTARAAPIRGAGGRVALGGAAIFAMCLTVRSSAWIVPLDLAAVALLVLLAVALDRAPSLRHVGFFAIG